MDCGPTCLQMISLYHGKKINIDTIRKSAEYRKDGVSLLGLYNAAKYLGYEVEALQLKPNELIELKKFPTLIHWGQNHFAVLIKIKKNFFGKISFIVADPALGIIQYNTESFIKNWTVANSEISSGDKTGIALSLNPLKEFYRRPDEQFNKVSLRSLLTYLKLNLGQLSVVFFALLIITVLQIIFPILTQSIVDTGIKTKNISFITVILIAQLTLVFSRTFIEFIRSNILLQVASKINLTILSDFWIKLMRLPLSYYDSFQTGDTIQRINDNKKIQSFLTGNAITLIFSLFSILVYSIMLLNYNALLFNIFLLGSVLYLIWMNYILRIRKTSNYQSFEIASKENTKTLQLIQGMQEIRLNGAEEKKRWEWESIQARVFKLSFKILRYGQLQQAGSIIINQGKDIIITYIVASQVINGSLSLGSLIAIQYIIGQMSGPIDQLTNFAQNVQDTKISLDRLNDIYNLEDEEQNQTIILTRNSFSESIVIENLNFRYPGSGNDLVLNDITITIPKNKTLAIVGASGSGKTTLMKLLLKVYDNYEGKVFIDSTNLQDITASSWRSLCGSVLQDGFIFNDTIENNITIGCETYDHYRLTKACQIANIDKFINNLANKYKTKIGTNGLGLSQGQKQRLLIARAIYKDPEFLFFDEATNALDANNEREITENLQTFLKNKSVIIVAHRLSTVKSADMIVVLDKGRIAESGNHQQLTKKKGLYYTLVKNQLEMGE